MELVTASAGTSAEGLPEGWTTKTLGQIALLGGGVSASRAQLSDQGHRYLHYGDIHVTDRTHVHAHDHYDHRPRLDVPLSKVKASALLRDGDVVFVDASEDAEGVSRYVVVSNPNNVPFVSGLHTIVATGLTDHFDPLYLRYAFQADDILDQFRFYAAGAKVSGMSKGNLAKVVVRIPPREEQEAIAAVLSDIDTLIGLLNALIAKKRDLKTGAMQRLLTGRQRLAGFSGKWERVRLGQIGTFSKGRSITRSQVVSEGVPCVRYGELYTVHRDIIRSFASHVAPEVASTAYRLRQGDILFAGSGETKEEIGLSAAFVGDEEAYAGGDIVILSPHDADPTYLGYALNAGAVARQKASRAQGDAVVHISAGNLATIKIDLPCLDEQQAIAAVLADMDAEIAALEARRDKTRQLREGMMQELLTGRTRLV